MSLSIAQKSLPQFLKGQNLMHGLSDAELAMIIPHLAVVSYEPGQIIFEEDELSSDLYLIFEGEVSLLKYDETKKSQHLIGKLSQGDMFGEMSFLDDSPRSCSIKTNHPLILVKVDKNELEKGNNFTREVYGKLIRNIAAAMIEKLRQSNVNVLKSGGKEIRHLLTVNEFGHLFLNLIVCMLLACGLSGIIYLSGYGKDYFFLANVMTVAALLVPILYFVKTHGYPLSRFGITTEGWQTSAFLKAAFVIFVAVVFLMAVKYISSLLLGVSPSYKTVSIPFFLIYPLYAFLVEFIFRGVMQTSIRKFLPYDPKWKSVVYTSLIVAANNFYFGLQTAVLTLFLNLVCGFFYLFNPNLLAVTVIHIFIFLTLYFFDLISFNNL